MFHHLDTRTCMTFPRTPSEVLEPPSGFVTFITGKENEQSKVTAENIRHISFTLMEKKFFLLQAKKSFVTLWHLRIKPQSFTTAATCYYLYRISPQDVVECNIH